MNRYLLTITLLITVGFAFGQRAGNTLVSFQVGANLPVGDFASISLDNPSAGFAQTGMKLNVMGLYKVTRRLGVGGMLTGHTNWANNAGYQSAFQQRYPDLENWSVNAQRWSSGGVLAGIGATLPLGDNLDVVFKAFAGGVLAYTPKVEIIGEIDGKKEFLRLYEQHKTGSFAFETGLTLMFSTGEKNYLMVAGDYFFANPVFKDIKVLDYEDPEGEPVITTRTYAPGLQSINVTIGFGYYL